MRSRLLRLLAAMAVSALPVVPAPLAHAFSRPGLPIEILQVPSPAMNRNIRVEFQGGDID